MEKPDAVAALHALGQETRLDIYRLLVQAGAEGIAAGAMADALNFPPAGLSFHFERLRLAGLASVRREGRSMIYTANLATIWSLLSFLMENLSGDVGRRVDAKRTPSPKRKRRTD